MLSMLDPHSSHWSRSSKGSPRPWVSTRQWCTAQPPPAMDSIHRGNEGNVYRMPTFKTAMTAMTWKYSNFLLKPFESNRIQIEDGKNWFTIWDFLFMDFWWNFFHHFAWTKRPKSIKIYEIYQNPTSASPDSNLALAKSFSSNKACDLDTISVDVDLGSASRIEMIEMTETWLKLCRNMKNSQWTNVTCENMKKAWSNVIQRLQQHYQVEVDHFGCCFCFKWPRLHLDIWRASRDHSKHPERC